MRPEGHTRKCDLSQAPGLQTLDESPRPRAGRLQTGQPPRQLVVRAGIPRWIPAGETRQSTPQLHSRHRTAHGSVPQDGVIVVPGRRHTGASGTGNSRQTTPWARSAYGTEPVCRPMLPRGGYSMPAGKAWTVGQLRRERVPTKKCTSFFLFWRGRGLTRRRLGSLGCRQAAYLEGLFAPHLTAKQKATRDREQRPCPLGS